MHSFEILAIRLKLPVLVWPLSDIEPLSHPLIFNSPWSFGYIRKLTSPLEAISLTVLCAANITRPGISKLHSHCPLRVPIYALFEWSLGDLFLVCREIHDVSQCRIRTMELSICRRTYI